MRSGRGGGLVLLLLLLLLVSRGQNFPCLLFI